MVFCISKSAYLGLHSFRTKRIHFYSPDKNPSENINGALSSNYTVSDGKQHIGLRMTLEFLLLAKYTESKFHRG